MVSLETRFVLHTLIAIIVLLIFNEYLIYYLVQYNCNYSSLNSTEDTDGNAVQVMVLADTHLLGSRNGHWFDKLRREWQMYRSFQTAMTVHKPELVFILGDITDEGLFCSEAEFQYYVKRFNSLFYTPANTKLLPIVGNHDIGFHYSISPYLNNRFIEGFNSSGVQLVSERNVHFVLINSMAMHGDGCFLCKSAERELAKLEKTFKCSIDGSANGCQSITNKINYSRPIIMQHFPLYRKSDMVCNESDSAPFPIRKELFIEKRECLSKESTNQLLKQLNPRLAMSGHTHHGCIVPLANGQGIEITVPSFSWRNKINPTYYLLLVTPDDYSWGRCHMPNESTVINIYLMGACILILRILYYVYSKMKRRKCKYH